MIIESLKRQKDISELSLLDQIAKVDSNEPIDIYAQEDSDLKKIQNDEDYDIFDETNDEKEIPQVKSEGKKKQELWRKNALEFKKRKYKPNLDPFKYNPNYNSIYKNIPTVKIIDPKKSLSVIDSKSKEKNRKKSKEKSQEKTNPLITEANIVLKTNNNKILKKIEQAKTPNKRRKLLNTMTDMNNSNKSSIVNNIKLPKLTRLSKIKNVDSINSDNQNHALRFSKYIPRRYIIPDHNKNVSYLNPVNYIKPKNKTKSIDFDKMLHRNEKNLLNVSCLKNQFFGQYNPKYNYIEKNEQVKLFNPEEKDMEKHRKYLMRKLWASYKVNTEYQLVDNNKINN